MKLQPSVFVAATAALAVSLPAFAQVRLDRGHFDIEVETEFNSARTEVEEIELIIANEDFPGGPFPDISEIDADEGFFVPGNFRIQSGPLGSIAPGSPVFFIPETQDPDTLWLGIGSEETGPGVVQGDAYALRLVGFSGPGNFIASQAGIGGPVIFVDSSAPTGVNTLVASTLGDNHYEFAFDAVGTYELTFEATGTLTSAFGGGDVSATATYTFLVPEPATAGLLAVAGIVGLRRRR